MADLCHIWTYYMATADMAVWKYNMVTANQGKVKYKSGADKMFRLGLTDTT